MTGIPRKSLEPWLGDWISYYDHQVKGVRWMLRHRNFLLADDMGTGKSLQALTTFAADVHRGWATTMLIVCPIILKDNWRDEIQKFTTIPCTVLDGGPDARAVQIAGFMLQAGPRILITNYETVHAELDLLNALHFDVLLLDEAHHIKNPEAKRTQSVLQLYSHRTFVLTGTPMLNRITELWPLLHRIDPKLFPNYYKFMSRYVVRGGHNKKEIVGIKNENELIERLSNVMIRRLKKDVLDLPEVNRVERILSLYSDQQTVYDKIADELILPRPDASEEEIKSHLTKMLRLKQVCGNLMEFTGKDVSAKMDAALVDDSALIETGEKIVIFTQFRSVMDLYAQRLRRIYPDLPIFELHGGVPKNDRHPMTKRWAAVTGSAVLICMLQIASEGLNLVASKNVSFLDELWTPGKNQQAVDRVHRIGADVTQPVTVRTYLCKDTVEERVKQVLTQKSALITGIIEMSPGWQRVLVDALREQEAKK